MPATGLHRSRPSRFQRRSRQAVERRPDESSGAPIPSNATPKETIRIERTPIHGPQGVLEGVPVGRDRSGRTCRARRDTGRGLRSSTSPSLRGTPDRRSPDLQRRRQLGHRLPPGRPPASARSPDRFPGAVVHVARLRSGRVGRTATAPSFRSDPCATRGRGSLLFQLAFANEGPSALPKLAEGPYLQGCSYRGHAQPGTLVVHQ